MARNVAFKPDWASAPGDTIADVLQEKGLSIGEFAQRIGRSVGDADELLAGHAAITEELAGQLQRVLGGSAGFWMTREFQYRENIAHIREGGLEIDRDWLREIPVKDMLKFGWLGSLSGFTDEFAACLRFFDVPDVHTWRATYRRVLEVAAMRTSPSFESKPGAVAAWLRQGEIESESIECQSWDPERFREVLPGIRSLTRRKEPRSFIPELQSRCAECGIALVVVRAPNGCRASGATRFLSSTRALVLLSFRYLSDDQFWFTFFHEAGHLLLHGQKALFLEGADMPATKEERDADEFAAGALIPIEAQDALRGLAIDGHEVIKFARAVGVSPGIVVGQLQHARRIKPNQVNSLKRRFRWQSA